MIWKSSLSPEILALQRELTQKRFARWILFWDSVIGIQSMVLNILDWRTVWTKGIESMPLEEEFPQGIIRDNLVKGKSSMTVWLLSWDSKTLIYTRESTASIPETSLKFLKFTDNEWNDYITTWKIRDRMIELQTKQCSQMDYKPIWNCMLVNISYDWTNKENI